MCTALTFYRDDTFFGRNMDIEYSFGERVVFVPRKFPLSFQELPTLDAHFAILGMAAVLEGYPLFAECFNEKGLCGAGLNFPGYAHYGQRQAHRTLSLAPYELLPYVLGTCETVAQVKVCIDNLNLIDTPFLPHIPLAPLHFMFADGEESIVVEPTKTGIHVYDNPAGVMTNNPEFPFHMTNLSHYLGCVPTLPTGKMPGSPHTIPLGQGAGALGLPGDSSPTSRFVRTVFHKGYSHCESTEMSAMAQVFHILDNVAFLRGAVVTPSGKDDITTYSCCINASKLVYYYKTYDNNQITAISMARCDMDGTSLQQFPLETAQRIHFAN